MIMDDELVWFGYAKAALTGVIACPNRIGLEGITEVDRVVTKCADLLLLCHKERFPQQKFS